MAAIPYPSTSGRHGVPTLNIPFRAIISSSTSSSSNNRSPSPSALGSFANPFASVSSTTTTSSGATSSSSPAPTSPTASAPSPSSSSTSPAPMSAAPSASPAGHHDRHRHQQSDSSVAYNPLLFSSGRRSRRAARGPEVAAGGRRTGGRDIDDMSEEELREHASRRARLDPTVEGEEGSDDLAHFRQRSGMAAAVTGAEGIAAGLRMQRPTSSRSSTSSELPAYFVDPSLPQYEYRARPIWNGMDESEGSGQGNGVPAWARPSAPASGSNDIAPPFGSAAAAPTASFCVIPSTPERRILNLPNRNSPPVPPRSLPNTSGLSILRGSSLSSSVNSTSPTSTAGASIPPPASTVTAVPLASGLGPSALVQPSSETERITSSEALTAAARAVTSPIAAVPPPAYEEQDSSRRPSEADIATAVGMTRSESADSAGTAPTAFPTTEGGQPPILVAIVPGINPPPVPTRSVSLSNASIPTALRERVNVTANAGGSNSHSRDSSLGVAESSGQQEVSEEATVGRSMSWTASSSQEDTAAASSSSSAATTSEGPIQSLNAPTPSASGQIDSDDHQEELQDEEGQTGAVSESEDPSIVMVERGGPSHPLTSKRKRWSQMLMMPLTAASLSASSPLTTSPSNIENRAGGAEGNSPNPTSSGSSSSSSFFKNLLNSSPSPGEGSSTLRPNLISAVGRSSSAGSGTGTATPPAGSGAGSPSSPSTPGGNGAANGQGRRPLSTLANPPSSPTLFSPGSAWGMIGIGLGYSVNPTFSFAGGSGGGANSGAPTTFTNGNTNPNGAPVSQNQGRAGNGNQANPLMAMRIRPPIPSERRSSRAVGRHMRAATTLVPGSGNSRQHPHTVGMSDGSNEIQAGSNLTFPRRGASRTSTATAFHYDASESGAGSSSAAAVLGLSAREWALRLAWLGEGGAESEAASVGGPAASGTERERRSHSVSAM
ncbi:hypothetical protein OC846_006315 [Tilletia horrida]|uniref:Uncharacterized protein n=1 Tax=Tilletia horrida TaxID=155126 RepID=A0AAN6GK62_9BASI|nr:hypothetical protein OC846_006315 [Tilletia horrida]KAK0562182.1 hypothetical protein OC861_005453 [Tilletia horrida]